MAATNATHHRWKIIVAALGLFIFLSSALLLYDRDLDGHDDVGGDGVLLRMAAGAISLGFIAAAVMMGPRTRQADDLADKAAQQAQQSRRNEQHLAEQEKHREFALEVLGMGAAFDHLQHEALWQALRQGDPYTSVRNRDPKLYPWRAAQKLEASATRSGAIFAQAVSNTPIYWVAPLLYASLDGQGFADNAVTGIPPLPEAVVQNRFALAEHRPAPPERIVELAFALFDQYPDLPYAVVFADSSLARREQSDGRETGHLAKDGYYLPAHPDAVAVLVLGRRDRAAALRTHGWADPNNDFVRVTSTRALRASLQAAKEGEKNMPGVAAWLAQTAILARDPQRYDGLGPTHMKAWNNDPPHGWKPTPWLPVAWTHAQLACFGQLPALAHIHRPVHIAFTDEQGHTIARNDRRLERLMDGWCEALRTLPAAVRDAGPLRVIASTGNNERQLLALHGLLHQYAAQGGPEIDTSDIASFTDMGRRLGDAGAATLPLQLVLGVLASHKAGGVSAVIHMQTDGAGATIVFVRPMENGPCET